MALKKWTSGDTITERSANNKGVRKGLTSDLDGISAADLEEGDHFFNETEQNPQVLSDKTNSVRSNLIQLVGIDINEVTVTGVTATEVKNIQVNIDPTTIAGNQVKILVKVKTSNAGTTAHVRCRWDDDAVGPPAELDLTTTSITFVLLKGVIDIGSEADGIHTLNFYMDECVMDQ